MVTSHLTGTVASNVQQAILAAGKNPHAIAKSTGIPLATLQRRLKGIESQSFTISELDLIARELGISVADLVGREAA